MNDATFPRLAEFAAGADLLLYDAQFTEEEYPKKRGFGHSSAQQGMELMWKSRAKRLLLIHHAPSSSDAVLARREKLLSRINVLYAWEGETLEI